MFSETKVSSLSFPISFPDSVWLRRPQSLEKERCTLSILTFTRNCRFSLLRSPWAKVAHAFFAYSSHGFKEESKKMFPAPFHPPLHSQGSMRVGQRVFRRVSRVYHFPWWISPCSIQYKEAARTEGWSVKEDESRGWFQSACWGNAGGFVLLAN